MKTNQYEQARQDAYRNGDIEAIEHIIDAEAAGIPLNREPSEQKKRPSHTFDPGAGAIAYARPFVDGKTEYEALDIMRELFEDLPDDKRVKRCEYCQFAWRDDSLRNTKHTCCDECKTAVKTLQRRQQRADKLLLAGEPKAKKKTKRDVNYISWLEYPFWLSEYEMLKQAWKYEVSMDAEGIDYISAQNEIYGEGNRKVGTQEGSE